MKFIAVGFMCVSSWLLYVKHASSIVHCSLKHCHNIVGTMSLDSILVPSVVSVSVPFTELHKHAYLLLRYESALFSKKLWLII